jgi:hypothetical protein
MRKNREFDLREQIARIDRDGTEARQLELEARQLDDARHIEIDRRLAELRKFDAEARRQDRECWQGWQIAVSAMTAGAALFAAGAAFKLLT